MLLRPKNNNDLKEVMDLVGHLNNASVRSDELRREVHKSDVIP
jgi:hypothetical protein